MQHEQPEKTLANFVAAGKFEDITADAVTTARNMTLTNIGTLIAGATADGVAPLLRHFRELGGKEESTVLMHGGRMPAHHAGFINSVMARALDFDDSIMPGAHIGASTVPAALAVAELMGGCSGRDFLAALTLGTEIGARLNLTDKQYSGYDPTGICSVFAATAVAGRLLGLDESQMHNALALAFNRSGGSYQSHVSGTLAVRLTQGFVTLNGIMCARLAQMGMTGPADFLTGVYGYFHLYGRDEDGTLAILDGLGESYRLNDTMFKKYPSCGGTQGSTEVILAIMEEHGLVLKDVESVDIKVTPSTFRLVGKRFEVGDNPKVDAQFNIRYCVASALLRKGATLNHFDDDAIKEPTIMEIARSIRVAPDESLDARGLTALDMRVVTRNGDTYSKSIDVAIGFPGKPLTQQEHADRFLACIDYAAGRFPRENAYQLVSSIEKLEEIEDIRSLITLLLP
jgi:2-methylcitrate dehydratase PrpD